MRVKMLVSRVAVGVVLMGAVSAARAQTTWHVDDDNCPGPGSGTPGDPFCRVQDAIDAALDNDEVVVAPGTCGAALERRRQHQSAGMRACCSRRDSSASRRTS